MAKPIQRLWTPLLRAAAVVSLLAGPWASGQVRAGSPTYCGASVDSYPGVRVLNLFPLDGPARAVALPDNLPSDFSPVAFGPDGRTIYGVSRRPGEGSGIWKIEFRPTRASRVPGSNGLAGIWHLTVALHSGRLLVSGPSKRTDSGECGSFEIDPETGAFRTLRAGKFPDCGASAGPISPDGKRAVTSAGKQLALIELETGATHVIKGIDAGDLSGPGFPIVSKCEWSHDGRWIACNRDDRIVLIGVDNTSERKHLGRSGGGSVQWSPDSKEILLAKSQFVCGFGAWGSLWVVDVSTGKRRMIKSSHCEIVPSLIGWIDLDSVP